MRKKLLATGVLLCLMAIPTFADTMVKTYTSRAGKTYVITITYTDSNGNGKIDTFREFLSITNIQVTTQAETPT